MQGRRRLSRRRSSAGRPLPLAVGRIWRDTRRAWAGCFEGSASRARRRGPTTRSGTRRRRRPSRRRACRAGSRRRDPASRQADRAVVRRRGPGRQQGPGLPPLVATRRASAERPSRLGYLWACIFTAVRPATGENLTLVPAEGRRRRHAGLPRSRRGVPAGGRASRHGARRRRLACEPRPGAAGDCPARNPAFSARAAATNPLTKGHHPPWLR
jgi:hypothetical protein